MSTQTPFYLDSLGVDVFEAHGCLVLAQGKGSPHALWAVCRKAAYTAAYSAVERALLRIACEYLTQNKLPRIYAHVDYALDKFKDALAKVFSNVHANAGLENKE